MSTFQLSFKTRLGFIFIKESEGCITDINFKKTTKQNKSFKLLKAKKEIKQFLNKKIKKFTFKSKTVGTKTQLKVWNEIKKIGYAKTVSYNFISKKTKIHPRHVGRICGQNRLLLFIPCHRVIRCDGLLGGFSANGGVKLKNKILKFEKLNK
ncbi:Ada Methylated DNA-protein cysteine methyltransferase [Candidatus Pelagibacterales bacterium]